MQVIIFHEFFHLLLYFNDHILMFIFFHFQKMELSDNVTYKKLLHELKVLFPNLPNDEYW